MLTKEIQEKRIEKEISILESSDLKIKISKQHSEEYSINIIFDNSIINYKTECDVEFLINFGPNFPFKAPFVYCKSKFCSPNIADGRDLLENIIKKQWVPQMKIIDIISQIPPFINEFLKNLNENVLLLTGNYYLGEKYDMSIIESLPVMKKKVIEKVNIDGKDKNFDRLLLVSDLYICLFDLERWSRNTHHLVFWSNMRSLFTIKKIVKENILKFFFKQKHRQDYYEVNLVLDEADEMIKYILNIMNTLGINYKVKEQNQKTGTLPKIDIKEVEKSICELEPEAQNKENVEKLTELYQKAIEYFSATNDGKYQQYLGKMHKLLETIQSNENQKSEERKEQSINIINNSSQEEKMNVDEIVKEKHIVSNIESKSNEEIKENAELKEESVKTVIAEQDNKQSKADIKEGSEKLQIKETINSEEITTPLKVINEDSENNKNIGETVQNQTGIVIDSSDNQFLSGLHNNNDDEEEDEED